MNIKPDPVPAPDFQPGEPPNRMKEGEIRALDDSEPPPPGGEERFSTEEMGK